MGRPKGSKNKKTLEKEQIVNIKSRRGRPKGSTNKYKANKPIEKEQLAEKEQLTNERQKAFECSCGYVLYYKQYKSKDIDEITTSQKAVIYIQHGCPKCGTVNKNLRDYLMKVKPKQQIMGANKRLKTSSKTHKSSV